LLGLKIELCTIEASSSCGAATTSPLLLFVSNSYRTCRFPSSMHVTFFHCCRPHIPSSLL